MSHAFVAVRAYTHGLTIRHDRRRFLRHLGLGGTALGGALGLLAAPPHAPVPTTAATPAAGGAVAGGLADLARLHPWRAQRRSSYDHQGGDRDFVAIPAGGRLTLAELAGAGVITHLWTTAEHADPLSGRNLVLRLYWDGETAPSVESPLGDFFGQGWAAAYPFVTLPLAAMGDGRGLNCFFPMPFAAGAHIEVENQSAQPVTRFYYHVDYQELPQLPADLGRFHAWWHRALTPPRLDDRDGWGSPGFALANPSDRDNYLVLEAVGQGHYVGMNYYVDNPSPEWPGEGDEVFLIDGESWPGSLPGTGTEDYFGLAWSPTAPAQHPYLGYARVAHGLGWLGRAHAYRFHLEGPIPFQRALRVSFEHGHANARTLDLATVAYWYQTEPHRPFPPLPAKEERAPMPALSVEDVARWRAAWERSLGGGLLWGNERPPGTAEGAPSP